MNPPLEQSPPTNDERLYLRARVVLCAVLLLIYLFDVPLPGGPVEKSMYGVAWLLLAGGTLAVYLASRRGAGAVARSMTWLLPTDLVAIAAFTYIFHSLEDAFYPVVLLVPISYSLVSKRRDTWMVAAAVAVAYIVGHAVDHAFSPIDYMLFSIKALAIPLIGGMVAASASAQRELKEQADQAVADNAMTNLQLEQRLTELQAVAQVTEIIHSSLDFNSVGPLVIDILGKVINVDACSLFVIDKERSETLFSASRGDVSGSMQYGIAGAPVSISDHFSCRAVFDHAETIVLFCADSDDIERLTEEDMLVLGAAASELVVAVENSRLYRLTKKLAITDELTGLFNYRELQTRLGQEVDRATRYGKHLSLLMIDADDFKGFNDLHGHVAGDVALMELASVLSGAVREVDLAARYGGEEFAVMLPETDAAGAFIVAEKIRDEVEQFRFADADGERCCSLTVSIGLATFPANGNDRETMLRVADDALYRAKDGGKNRVRAPQRANPMTQDEDASADSTVEEGPPGDYTPADEGDR